MAWKYILICHLFKGGDNMNVKQIKETTPPTEVVSIQSNILFDTNMGFNPDLDFVSITEFK